MNYRDKDDKTLALEAQAGDSEAFDELALRYRDPLCGHAYRWTNNLHDAQDITQDAFLNAWSALPRWRPEAKFRTWLYAIATNLCIDHGRSVQRQRTVALEEDMEASIPDESVFSDPERIAAHNELSELIRGALSLLSDHQRRVVELVYFEYMKIREAAAAMGVKEGTVKAHLDRAKKRLRKHLQPILGELF